MSYEVLVGELRAAATEHRGVADALGAPVTIGDPTPERLGHIELAAWLGAVKEQCERAHSALASETTGLGDALDAAARDYEATDQCVATSFTPSWMPGPGAPLGTSNPLFSPPGSWEGR